MTKTIAITGATGFVGGAMTQHFLAQGWRVLAFGRRETIPYTGNIRYIQWDITEGTITVDEPVQAVIHSAAFVNDWGKYEQFYQANVIGTQNVLDTFPDVEHFIHISSSSVYEPRSDKYNIDETYPYAEKYLNHYGATKKLAEQLILKTNRPNYAVLRPHAIYGSGDTTILPRLLNAHRGNFLIGIGDGNNQSNLTYIANLCHAAECVTKTSFACDVFNIVDAEPVSMQTILQTLNDELGLNAKVVFIPSPIALGIANVSVVIHKLLKLNRQPTLTPYRVHNLISEYTISISKAQDILDYHPPYDFQAGIQVTKNWLENENGWAVIQQAM